MNGEKFNDNIDFVIIIIIKKIASYYNSLIKI